MVPTRVKEGSPSGTFVCQVSADDADASTDNSMITYSLEGPHAGMSNTKGVFTTSNNTLNRTHVCEALY